MDGEGGGFGLSHLGSMPITLTYGAIIFGALLLLLLLRVFTGGLSANIRA